VLLKRDVCTCKEQYPGASQQNIDKYFSLVWSKPISQHCGEHILTEEKKWENETCRGFDIVEGCNT
jgi:hypothetical protein